MTVINHPISPSPQPPSINALPIIGITMGDPTGIGPEIILKALSRQEPFEACRPVVFGDPEVLSMMIRREDLSAQLGVIDKIPQEGYQPGKVFVVPVSLLDSKTIEFGKPDRECGKAMGRYIEEAVKWLEKGMIDAITTCPINKQAINRAGYPFSGHTELLAHLAKSPAVAMMFLGSMWKVVLVTTHLSIKEVPKWITRDRILITLQTAEEGLRRHFGVHSPRLAVLGLNPHCGEEGLLGEEEENQIIPAINEAKSRGMRVEGPFPADSFFNISGRNDFDAVIAMYHDQGLIPIKILNFKDSVNFTLGLPFVRTSVAHGTAYDIAGKGLADPTNLVKTIVTTSNILKLKA